MRNILVITVGIIAAILVIRMSRDYWRSKESDDVEDRQGFLEYLKSVGWALLLFLIFLSWALVTTC